jgi:hypothetical protein
MPGVELQPKGNFDMTWFRGSDPSPLDIAERIVFAFVPPDVQKSLGDLAAATGLPSDEVADRIPSLVARRFLAPLTEGEVNELADSTARLKLMLRLGERGLLIAASRPDTLVASAER